MQHKLSTSTPAFANEMLAEVLAEYPFRLLKKGPHIEVYYLDYNNESNCQGRFLLRVLNDNKTLRLSVCEADSDIMDAVDLFEFQGFGKLHDFMKLVV